MVLYVPFALATLGGLDFKLWYMGGTNRTLTPPLINCIGERWLGPVDRKWREADGVFSLPELWTIQTILVVNRKLVLFFVAAIQSQREVFRGNP